MVVRVRNCLGVSSGETAGGRGVAERGGGVAAAFDEDLFNMAEEAGICIISFEDIALLEDLTDRPKVEQDCQCESESGSVFDLLDLNDRGGRDDMPDTLLTDFSLDNDIIAENNWHTGTSLPKYSSNQSIFMVNLFGIAFINL